MMVETIIFEWDQNKTSLIVKNTMQLKIIMNAE
jgi:hypothetical protein